MNNGFLPTRATFAIDLLVVSMLVILVTLFVSIWLVRRGQYRLHKRLQIATTCFLVLAVLIFEIDVRFVTDWRKLAEPSPFFESGWVYISLILHLAFAIPTPFIWGVVIVKALRKFDKDPKPNDYSSTHRRMAWVAVGFMVMTSTTGWVFYYVAFVAT